MAVEIEAKMKISEPAPVAQALCEQGARQIGDFLEENAYFDQVEKSLMTGDRGLRVRSARNTRTGETRAVMTYKGPRLVGLLKSREEIEIRVSDAASAALLLERVGLRCYLRFQKRRQSWELDECKIELDELPYLGHFCEIEAADEASVLRMRDRLGLGRQTLIKSGYAKMIAEYAEDHHINPLKIVFPA